MTHVKQAVISGTGLYTPPFTITNDDLVASFNAYVRSYNDQNAARIAAGELTPLQESSPDFIEKASGIRQRYVVEREGILDVRRMRPRLTERSDQELSLQAEISVAAANAALEQSGRSAAEVDFVIVACANMQRAYPAMSIEVQAALGIEGYAYDLNVACSSATFGIQAAANAIESGSARCVLMVNPEITSPHLNFRDRDSHFIFGDVCTAVIVERADARKSNDAYEIVSTRLSTHYSNSIRNNLGFMNHSEDADPRSPDKLFRQQGRKVFKDVVPMVVDLLKGHLAEHGLDAMGLKRLWLHQANIKMNELIARKLLGRDATFDEAPTVLQDYANTASAGSIIAFHKHRGDVEPGDLGVICSFGAGYSIGNILVRKLPSRS
jgi:beta-ketodecanoyl-[acyl-carrier-protein] synthase